MLDSRFLSRLCDPERNGVTGQESALPGVILFILYNARVHRGSPSMQILFVFLFNELDEG